MFFATQNLNDIFGNEKVIAKTSAILNNLYRNVGGLNETERSYITNADRGDCFAICSARKRTRFHVVAHDTVRALFVQPDFELQDF